MDQPTGLVRVFIADSRALDENYVPLSVRFGGRRARIAWWLKAQRERAALRIAPWLTPGELFELSPATHYELLDDDSVRFIDARASE